MLERPITPEAHLTVCQLPTDAIFPEVFIQLCREEIRSRRAITRMIATVGSLLEVLVDDLNEVVNLVPFTGVDNAAHLVVYARRPGFRQ